MTIPIRNLRKAVRQHIRSMKRRDLLRIIGGSATEAQEYEGDPPNEALEQAAMIDPDEVPFLEDSRRNQARYAENSLQRLNRWKEQVEAIVLDPRISETSAQARAESLLRIVDKEYGNGNDDAGYAAQRIPVVRALQRRKRAVQTAQKRALLTNAHEERNVRQRM